MSFVIGFATPSAALIVSDGRCQGKNNTIITEYYNKTKRINDKVIIGFAGETALCEAAINALYTPAPVNAVATNLSANWTVNGVSICLCSFLKSLQLGHNRKCSFIVAGSNSNHQIELDTFGIISDLAIKSYIPTTTDVQYATLSPDGVDGDKIVENHLTGNYGYSSIEDALKGAIADVAKINHSVNTNYYSQVILL